MSSSSTTTQLGRNLWSSIRDSVGILTARVPLQQHRPLNRLGLSHSFVQPTTSSSSRAFHTSRWCSLPNRATASPKNVRKSCTSGGLLLIGLTSGPSSAPSVVATCTAAAESSVVASKGNKASLSSLARQAWRQTPHTRRATPGRRNASSKPEGEAGKGAPTPSSKAETGEKPATGSTIPEQHALDHESLANSMSKYLHIPHLPKMPHRPTKEELLAAASGFWSRLKVRFKWFSIRSMRPWNADEWGAFLSWFVFGHIVWILVGTTTFFSLVILTINTVFAQGRQAPIGLQQNMP
jgi:distribution and morphology protein 31